MILQIDQCELPIANSEWTFRNEQCNESLFLAMANFGAHAAFLTALFAATLTRLFCTQ